MKENEFFELVTKYLANEISFEEMSVLKELLNDKYYQDQFNKIEVEWSKIDEKVNNREFNEDRGLRILRSKIRKYEPDMYKTNPLLDRIHDISFSHPMRVAASFILLMTIAISMLYFNGIIGNKSSSNQWQEKITEPGQKMLLTLLDGTKITLNADSKLKYPLDFSKKTRDVYLEGEAYFEVAHNPAKPFIVHTGDLTATVLGTKFNVNAFPKDNFITVSLVQGKLKVTNIKSGLKKDPVILSPREQIKYNVKEHKMALSTFNIASVTGWKDNTLVFDNEPLSNVFEKLNRAFGVEFNTEDKMLENKKIKAYLNNESLWTVIQIIKSAANCNYKIINENGQIKKVVFY